MKNEKYYSDKDGGWKTNIVDSDGHRTSIVTNDSSDESSFGDTSVKIQESGESHSNSSYTNLDKDL